MNLYLLTQTDADGYDTYDSCVVAAEDEHQARWIHPFFGYIPDNWRNEAGWASHPDKVTVKLLGQALPETPRGVILASYISG